MHRPPWQAQTPFFCRIALFSEQDPLTTHQLFLALRCPSFSFLQSPCALLGTHFPPLTAPLSRRGFSGSLAPPSLICTNFPAIMFLPRHPFKLPFPFCVNPSRGGWPRLAQTISQGPQSTRLGHLLVSPPDRGAWMGAAREGTRACAAAPGPPGSRRRAAPGADSALPFPSRVHWGRGWRGRSSVDSRLLSCVGDFFVAFCCCHCGLRAVRCTICVLCMPLGDGGWGRSAVNKVPISLDWFTVSVVVLRRGRGRQEN